MENKIKVLVIDDSAYNRKVISGMLESSPEIKVVGTASDGEEGIISALKLKPDVITLDLEMPRMDGFTFLRIMMSRFPTPTIVISSRGENKSVFKALEFGAVDFIAKPTHHISPELLKIQEELVHKVHAARSVRMDILKLKSPPAVEKTLAAVETVEEKKIALPEPRIKPDIADMPIVVIGSSTGGPAALQTVLSAMPASLPAAVAVAQHMPAGFTRTFSNRLDKISPLHVKEAENGDPLMPGHVLIAPGGFHLTFAARRGQGVTAVLRESDSDKYVPSVDRLFESAAEIFGPNVIGVVMTGMGNDGKEGIRRIKDKGGRTIAQSEDTSIIFGMPREAISTGKVDSILPLEDIARGVVKMIQESETDDQ